MRNRKIKSQETSEVDMTPMLDIVFIMLIFFIVTTTFVKESGIEFNQPSTGKTSPEPSQAMLIKIDANETLTVNGREVLADSIRSNVEVSKSTIVNLVVFVQIAESVRTGLLVSVVDQVRLAGIAQVTVSRISR
ncbi:MAG: biopolymer transporter ExbD [Gammaproteobacteria bacterium]|nr:MAG: biopolymer transporter ExbD [Gammaproteobacteria bacterium]